LGEVVGVCLEPTGVNRPLLQQALGTEQDGFFFNPPDYTLTRNGLKIVNFGQG
jgi:hypothetical protein